MRSHFYVGTAGWAIPKMNRSDFPDVGSVLEKYAAHFNAVEINSSFYREHQQKTYARWARSVPPHFRFAVKLSKKFTHEFRLQAPESEISASLKNIDGLGKKWGALLVQLPPSLEFEPRIAGRFFKVLRKHYSGPLALEPRHISWVKPDALELFKSGDLSMVDADPSKFEFPKALAIADSIHYLRLHGSPLMYKSSYSAEALANLSKKIMSVAKGGRKVWCVFDNTAEGHACTNAMTLARNSGMTF